MCMSRTPVNRATHRGDCCIGSTLRVPSGTKIGILTKKGLYGNNQVSQLKADEAMNTVETKLKSRGITIIPANAGVVLQNPGFRIDTAHLNAVGHKGIGHAPPASRYQ